MTNVYIAGLGMIRFNKYPDKNVRSMAHEVIQAVLDAAALTKNDLQAAFFSNTFWGLFDNQH
ncbi:MAG: thiolase family protein, partial [Desulfobacterales bacterium]